MATANERRVILVVGSLAAGGAERVTIGLFEYLLSQGWDAYLYVAYWGSAAERVYSPGSHAGRVLHAGTHRSNLVRGAANLARLRSAIKELRPSWVVSLGASYGLVEAAGGFSACKALTSERNWPPAYYPSRKEFENVERVYGMSTRVVFQTEDALRCFSEAVQGKGRVIPNPVAQDLPQWRGGASKTLIYFGRLDPQKRPEVALRAFAEFCRSRPGYRLEFYGIGSERTRLEDLASQCGIENSVSFHDAAPDVHERARDCLLFVSSSDYEGISNSMLEALAMGMPCVCTDCGGGGARMAVESGVSGILVPCGDISAMAGAMGSIADSPALARKLSQGAVESAKRFDPNVIFSQWADLLSEEACF